MKSLLLLSLTFVGVVSKSVDKDEIIANLQKQLAAAKDELNHVKEQSNSKKKNLHEYTANGRRRLVDSDSWYKVGDPSKTCSWVAAYGKRCGVKGWENGDLTTKVLASEACLSACAYTSEIADVIISAEGTDCGNTDCMNRLHPAIPINVYADPGDIILFDTPAATCDVKDHDLYEENIVNGANCTASLHQLAGPLGINGAVAGDKIAITILDVVPTNWGWTYTVPGLGFLSDLPEDTYFNWWQPLMSSDGIHPESWYSDRYPNVSIPYSPFPGLVTVLPDQDIVDSTAAREAFVVSRGGSAAPAGNTELAYPSSVCGEGGSHADECLRTIAPGAFFGNEDTQRIAPGSTLIVDCFVDGCGIAIGDVHGGQGDGEVCITAIEMEAEVYISVDIIKSDDPRYVLPSPTLIGGSTIKDYTPSEWISFTGFPEKEQGLIIPQHATFGSEIENMTFVADNMALAGRNALLHCIQFLTDVLGYSFNQGLTLASAVVDLRVAQVVDKPAIGVEALLPLDIFQGDAYEKVYAASFGE
uniref:Formamidase n=1 Tax=Aureoumbra lagunensis TaxID=44058 RepID=A0A7S3NJY9_9STRA